MDLIGLALGLTECRVCRRYGLAIDLHRLQWGNANFEVGSGGRSGRQGKAEQGERYATHGGLIAHLSGFMAAAPAV